MVVQAVRKREVAVVFQGVDIVEVVGWVSLVFVEEAKIEGATARV